MRKLLPSLLLAILLTGCAAPTRLGTGTENLMDNPLFAQRYYDELTDRMVEIQLREKDVTDTGTLAAADRVRADALAKAQEQTAKKRGRKLGQFLSIKEATEGWALLLGNILYVSSDFVTYPGPSLHLYLTTVLDPRDGTFPDATSIDLGLLSTPYGAQQYTLPAAGTGTALRTAVLYDTELKRLYAFAQPQ